MNTAATRAGRFRFALEILKGIRRRLGPRLSGYLPDLGQRVSSGRIYPGGRDLPVLCPGKRGRHRHQCIRRARSHQPYIHPAQRCAPGHPAAPGPGDQIGGQGAGHLRKFADPGDGGTGRFRRPDGPRRSGPPPDRRSRWPLKVREGRTREIRACIRCNQGCFGGLRDLKTLRPDLPLQPLCRTGDRAGHSSRRGQTKCGRHRRRTGRLRNGPGGPPAGP